MTHSEIDAADLKTIAAKTPSKRRGKYNNKKITIDGHRFDSLREGAVYVKLKALESVGTISNLELHPPLRCEVNGVLVCTYQADFRFVQDGVVVVVDVKGVRTPVYRLKCKLVRALHGIEIQEW